MSQVGLSRDSWSTTSKEKEEHTMRGSASEADFEAASASAKVKGARVRADEGPEAKKPRGEKPGEPGNDPSNDDMDLSPHEKQQFKDVLLAIKKHHSGWDKAVREANQVLVASSGHRNSKGTVLESDLSQMVVAGGKLDTEVVTFEALVGDKPTCSNLQDLSKVLETNESLGKLTKDIRKKMKGVRDLWKA